MIAPSLNIDFHTAQSHMAGYHTAVLCTVVDGIIYSVCSHVISHRLATPIESRGNTSQQPLSKDQQDFSSWESSLDFSSRESTLFFSTGFSQRWFSSGFSHLLLRILFTGFLILIIMLNGRLFSTAHHRCRIDMGN